MRDILYAITDSQLLPGDTLFSHVEAALKGGCRWIQYREKSQHQERRLYESKKLLDLCNQHGARLIINDDVQLAHAICAHGVHLGQEDSSTMHARQLLGEQAIIGVTCHDSLILAQQALAQGANYIAFGRFYSSVTKPGARPAPIDLIREARSLFKHTTIVAIGGITLENAQPLLDAGADKLAVCQGLFAAKDIAVQTTNFNQLMSNFDQ
jgi:thiamine-phosphate pyrophosphorylase